MTGILAAIDNTLAERCPCGSEPRPDSAYCCDDCVPNYHGTHTTSDRDGTAMRWRPDLVSEADDTGRELANEFRRGPYRAQVFTNAFGGVHCRLDDGNRYVGVDVDEHQEHLGLEPVWERLERELTDTRHSEPGDPWGDVMACPCGCGVHWQGAVSLQRLAEVMPVGIDEVLGRAMQYWEPSVLGEAYIAPPAPEIAASGTVACIGETATIQFDNSTGRFEPHGQIELPDGRLLDGLVAAEAEARLRVRAREIGATVNQPTGMDLTSRFLATRYLMTYRPMTFGDPRPLFRIISTA